MTPDDPRHGTYAGGRVHRTHHQNLCEPCRRAEARYEQARQLDLLNGRPRTIPALGTQRRLRALVALGHTFARIGEGLGITAAAAHAAAKRDRIYVRATTAAKVDALFEAWSMTLPPTTTSIDRKNAAYARTVARRNGWAPPLAWDNIDTDEVPHAVIEHEDLDQVVVERLLAGERIPSTPAEKHEAMRRWLAAGRSERSLCLVHGWKESRYTERRAA